MKGVDWVAEKGDWKAVGRALNLVALKDVW